MKKTITLLGAVICLTASASALSSCSSYKEPETHEYYNVSVDFEEETNTYIVGKPFEYKGMYGEKDVEVPYDKVYVVYVENDIKNVLIETIYAKKTEYRLYIFPLYEEA